MDERFVATLTDLRVALRDGWPAEPLDWCPASMQAVSLLGSPDVAACKPVDGSPVVDNRVDGNSSAANNKGCSTRTPYRRS